MKNRFKLILLALTAILIIGCCSDAKQRNIQILKAIEQGYSQHMIAKVLGISQQAVHGVVKRSRV